MTAWAKIQNADSQLQFAAAKAHPKFIKFQGGKDGIDIETYILRNEQLFTQNADDTQKVASWRKISRTFLVSPTSWAVAGEVITNHLNISLY